MRKIGIFLILFTAIVLSACSMGASTEEQLTDIMSEMNNAEKQYQEAQAKLTELEKAEQQAFIETMELTKEQTDELKTKVLELENLQKQRLIKLKDEESAIAKAKEFTTEFDAIIEKADEPVKQSIQELKSAVIERYDFHSTFVFEYNNLATIQKELYSLLVENDTDMEALTVKVEMVNAKNKDVQLAVIDFNSATENVNSLKKEIMTNLTQGK